MLTTQAPLQRAAELFQGGALVAAADLLARIVHDDPDQGRAWEMLGLIHWRWQDRDDTTRCLETASSLVPLRPEARCGLAECYAAAERRDLAAFLFQSVVDDPRSGIDVLLMSAAGADSIDRPSLSIRGCRAAIQIDPDCAQAFYDLGYYLGRCGAPPSRIEAAARKAVQLSPDHAPYRVGLASLLLRHSRFREAHRAVCSLSAAQVASISCGCCLERLAPLYDSFGDPERAGWCRDQLQRIAKAKSGDDTQEDDDE